MEFHSLLLTNFLSIDAAQISLRNRGVVLVSGENAAGKSSLTSKAISFALFGETVGGVKGDAVVPTDDPRATTCVALSFMVGSTLHRIVRQRNPTVFELDDVRHRIPAETQKQIHQLIGRDLESFLSTDYFGQDRDTDFLKMPPGAQVAALDGILRLDRLDVLVEAAKQRAIDERKTLDEHQEQVRLCEGYIEELERQIKLCEDKGASLIREMEGRQYILNQLDAQQAHIRRELLKAPEAKAHLTKIQLEGALEQTRFEMESNQQTLEVQQQNLRNERMHIAHLRSRVKEIQPEICPTCKGSVHADVTTALQLEQSEINLKLNVALRREIEIGRDIVQLHAQVKSGLAKIDTFEDELEQCRDRMEQYEKEVAEIDEKRADLRLKNERDEAVEAALAERIDEMTIALTSHHGVAALNEQGVKDAMKRLSAARYWMDIFGRTFKNFILEQALPYLQERTEHHLRLLNNSQLKVTFSTQRVLKSGEERHQFHVTASSVSGGQVEYSLSGGERQMVSFAVGLALSELADSQTGNSSNLMILDEPFTYLDSENIESVVNYITTELVKRKATILLISNDERMKALLPGGIHVERGPDGKSRIARSG